MSRRDVVTVIQRLARALDAQDWTAVRGCLDAKLDTDYSSFRGTPPARLTADEFVDLRRVGLAGLVTRHRTERHEVELAGDRAVCRCDFAIRRWSAEPSDPRFLHSYGTYRYVLRRGDDGWRIVGITQVVRRSEGDPALHGALRKTPSPDGGADRARPVTRRRTRRPR